MGISVQRTVQHNETTGGPFWRLRTYDPKRFDRACMYISHRNFIWPLWRHSRFQLVPSRTKASVSQADISIGASPIDPGRRGPEGNELHPHPIRSAGKLLERWTFCGFRVPRKVNIRQRIPISWQSPGRGKAMRRMREDHLCRRKSASTTARKAALAGCFATTLSAYNGTPAPRMRGQLGEILGGVRVPWALPNADPYVAHQLGK